MNPTHDSKQCFILKRLAREAKNIGNGKAHAKPNSNSTFRKEVNLIARRAGKHNGLKIMEPALKREQSKSLRSKPDKPAAKITQKRLQPKSPATMTLCWMNP
jgi:hypothetical protein